MSLSRRSAIVSGAAAGLSGCAVFRRDAADAWDAGEVRHLIPAVSSSRLVLRASFARPVAEASLAVDGKRVAGRRGDRAGRYWTFDAGGLKPRARYELQLFEGGQSLCAPWPLRTLPDLNARMEHCRIVVFTCAGGLESIRAPGGGEVYRPLALRQRLIDRALSFEPDALVANGDHIYWDQRAWLESPVPALREGARALFDRFGYFDEKLGFEGTANEDLIVRLAAPQIADLYGVRLRSTPSFFLCDDHDYFENDEATEKLVTFPPKPFLVAAQRATARLFYPGFLPHETRPAGLPGDGEESDLSSAFGTLRFGRLFEAQLFDCGRFLSLKDGEGLVPADVERWLLGRTQDEAIGHLMQMPSHPMGWSAGKWREWYPDIAVSDAGGRIATLATGARGRLSVSEPKLRWNPGWFAQHQRLVAALSAQRRPAVAISGDLHAIGHAEIRRAGDLDLGANPVRTILSGPVSTAGPGFPSAARGVAPGAPSGIDLGEAAAPDEKNGFTMLDIEPSHIRVRQFAWREPAPPEEIASMPPAADFRIERRR